MEQAVMEKPRASVTECVGCGFCCQQAQCSESSKIFGSAEVCPASLWHENNNRYVCGLTYLFEYQNERGQKALAIGEGCCSPCNDWRTKVQCRDLPEAL